MRNISWRAGRVQSFLLRQTTWLWGQVPGTGAIQGPANDPADNQHVAAKRAIPMAESLSVHFRMEFFDLINTPRFANPNNTAGFGTAFGTIAAKSNNPRIIQVALKYQF
jgi:hypothetical protein